VSVTPKTPTVTIVPSTKRKTMSGPACCKCKALANFYIAAEMMRGVVKAECCICGEEQYIVRP
jgi:hypothetical protein